MSSPTMHRSDAITIRQMARTYGILNTEISFQTEVDREPVH